LQVVQIGVVGGGVSGLAAALALARDGHHVTVLERDATPMPASADEAFDWDRRGAPQVRHSHAFLGKLRCLLRDEYPDLLAALYEAGATDLRFDAALPPTLVGYEPEPTDDDLAMLACRRTTFEWVLRRAALAEGRVDFRNGVAVDGLLVSPTAAAPLHVEGVRCEDGGTARFDATVVATGRRSALPAWLAAAGAPAVPEIHDDTGIVYFSRFYRLRPGQELPQRTGPAAGDLGYLKYGLFLGDNGTYSLTLAVAAEDVELRRLLDSPDLLDRTGSALTSCAAYLDGRAQPITGVHKIAGLLSRWRDYVVDGAPLALGLHGVGDAVLATNPLYGRGCTTGFWHAHLLAAALRQHPGDPLAQALAHDAATRAQLQPWVTATIRQDGEARRVAAAILAGKNPDADQTDPQTFLRSVLRDGLRPAMRVDPVVLRAFLRTFNLLAPPETLATDPVVQARVLAVWQDRDNRPPEPDLGPDRAGLLSLLAA
jgi:2-polyprenyl-6-methoxyphenol hydroxylase-like FAD-dependent oxidoreductase